MITTMRYKEEITKLKTVDVYSLVLFALFKLRDIPEYSTLSEMVYVLDKDSLLKLCEYFGGLTIKIPTIDELESLVYSLLLYEYVNVEKMPYADACDIIGHSSKDLRKVKSDYMKLIEILDKYDFTREESI